MFPTLDESTITKAIQSSHHNYNKALESILATIKQTFPLSLNSAKANELLGYPSVEEMVKKVSTLQNDFEMQQLNSSDNLLQSMFVDMEEMKNVIMGLELNERSVHLKEKLLQMVSASEAKLMKGIKPIHVLQQSKSSSSSSSTTTK